MVGATFQTASPLYTDDELERRFRECNTKFLVTIPTLTKRVHSLIYNIANVKKGQRCVMDDLAYFDSDGCLFIVDRLKELIKYKGLQVAPAYIEDILHNHPGIADVAVIGVPDEIAGELPKAFVVRQEGSNITADEVTKYVEDQMTPHMWLRGDVEFTDVIPRNPSGKILRRFLRDRKNPGSKL